MPSELHEIRSADAVRCLGWLSFSIRDNAQVYRALYQLKDPKTRYSMAPDPWGSTWGSVDVHRVPFMGASGQPIDMWMVASDDEPHLAKVRGFLPSPIYEERP